MSGLIKLILSGVLVTASMTAFGQLSNEAWANYKRSKYSTVTPGKQSDAIIIFDRTYLETMREKNQVVEVKTVHRKIRINTLYGLRQFNKLYIPTFKDLHYKIEFINCEAKTIKPNNQVVISDTSQFEETTLPANVPLFYKKTGDVKLLAIKDINVGDEIEYVYSIKSTYDIYYMSYQNGDRVMFSGQNKYLEKSVFFDGDDFTTYIWPHNFGDGQTDASDFTYKEGSKITLKNVNRNSSEVYANDRLDQPYVYYLTTKVERDDDEDSWVKFTKNFSQNIKKSKKTQIFDGLKFSEFQYTLDRMKGIKPKFEFLLTSLNGPIEKNMYIFDDIEDDIYVAWYHANIISKLMKKLQVPLQFHFVVDKNYGNLDREFAEWSQFDNIIISFEDDTKKKHYMSLLEPFSKMNEVKLKYQGTDCFTITQSETGKKTNSFGKIPNSERANAIRQDLDLTIKKTSNDSLAVESVCKVTYEGDAWLEMKSSFMPVINDTVDGEKDLKKYVKALFVGDEEIDSVYAIDFKVDSSSFTLSYTYTIRRKTLASSGILSIQPEKYLDNDFYTPFYQRDKRTVTGYLFNEPELHYSINFKLNSNISWIENSFLKRSLSNKIGVINSTYNQTSNMLNFSMDLNYEVDSFDKSEWKDVLDFRDMAYNLLSGKLYFEVK